MDDARTVIGRVLFPYFREHGAGICPEDSMEAEVRCTVGSYVLHSHIIVR
jgi:hypothetical protein